MAGNPRIWLPNAARPLPLCLCLAAALWCSSGCAQKESTGDLFRKGQKALDNAKATVAQAQRVARLLPKRRVRTEARALFQAADAARAAVQRLQGAIKGLPADAPPSRAQKDEYSAALADVDRATEALQRAVADAERKLPPKPKPK
jgi:hypothetical protein